GCFPWNKGFIDRVRIKECQKVNSLKQNRMSNKVITPPRWANKCLAGRHEHADVTSVPPAGGQSGINKAKTVLPEKTSR
ncbi:MAG: hypothetical protein NZ703_02475, partial [Gemmataceae bacterium]|nr:hypothetical protein [Gemmataceae bacterium]